MSGKTFLLSMVVAIVVVFFGISLSVVYLQAREDARRMECSNQLKQIGLALHNYHDTYGKFPPAQLIDHSWRVRVNPFMISSAYYDQYRFEEPWDGDWNHELEKRRLPTFKMPGEEGPEEGIGEINPEATYWMASSMWQCPSDRDEHSPHTNYLMPVGPGAIGRVDEGLTFKDVTDDKATTILVAETASSDIDWLEPQDFDVDTMSFQINDPNRPSISSRHPGGAHVVFCDGQVAFLSSELPPEVVKAMITIDGGEIIEKDEAAPGGYRLSEFRTQ